MKKFRKAALCLLAAVMALTMLAACGREKLDITVDPEKKAQVINVLNQYLEQTGKPAMHPDEKMEKAASKGLEPSVAYKLGKLSKFDYAFEVWSASGMTQSELQKTKDEGRYMGFTLPEKDFNDANIMKKIRKKFPQNVSVTKYGMDVAVYEEVVYVVMFME